MTEYIKKLRRGWTLNEWRMTTPHNYFIESPKGREIIDLEWGEFVSLRGLCIKSEDSAEIVPHTPLTRGGRPRLTKWRLSNLKNVPRTTSTNPL